MGRKGVLIRNYDSEGNLISMECGKCHYIKDVSEFHKDRSKKYGVKSTCKECDKELKAKYYKQNIDKFKEHNSEWYKQNINKIKEYRKQNGDKIKEKQKEYYKQNINKRKEYLKQNSEKIKEQKSEWYKKNVDKIKEQQAKYRKQNINKRKEYYNQKSDKFKEYRFKYYKQNYDKIKKQNSEYYKQKSEQSLEEIKAYIEQNSEIFNYNPNKEIYGIIYLVYNNKSQRYYVGQTINGFDIRYKSGWLYEHSHKATVKGDLELYGEDSFEYTKIFKVANNQKELDKLEAYYIEYFNSYENGYNETRGNIFTERCNIN